jgi:hypothetical protein
MEIMNWGIEGMDLTITRAGWMMKDMIRAEWGGLMMRPHLA